MHCFLQLSMYKQKHGQVYKFGIEISIFKSLRTNDKLKKHKRSRSSTKQNLVPIYFCKQKEIPLRKKGIPHVYVIFFFLIKVQHLNIFDRTFLTVDLTIVIDTKITRTYIGTSKKKKKNNYFSVENYYFCRIDELVFIPNKNFTKCKFQ